MRIARKHLLPDPLFFRCIFSGRSRRCHVGRIGSTERPRAPTPESINCAQAFVAGPAVFPLYFQRAAVRRAISQKAPILAQREELAALVEALLREIIAALVVGEVDNEQDPGSQEAA